MAHKTFSSVPQTEQGSHSKSWLYRCTCRQFDRNPQTMLVTVGGLMATLIFPGKAVPTLAVTATLSAITALRRSKGKPPREDDDLANGTANGSTPTAIDPSAAITLQWSDVSCVLTKKGDEKRVILDKASGVARPGRVLAIMGPSGSGKTTLLNVLAGRVQKASNISIHGTVTINGQPMPSVKDNDGNSGNGVASVPIAYVSQEDLFFSQLTVRETLDIAARLRLHDLAGHDTDDLIRRLGLVSCADSTVGDEKQRGISGGEKKRLSLGIELISTPRLILCDEPTTGLDAFQAERVMHTLRNLAYAGHTVICSIHQPSSAIFSLFDDLVLLAEGKQLYSGVAQQAEKHFTQAGFPPPDKQAFNPAERYLQLISTDYSSDDTVRESRERIAKLAAACAKTVASVTGNGRPVAAESTTTTTSTNTDSGVPNEDMTDTTATPAQGRVRMPGPLRHICVLLSRAWKQTTRDKKTNVSRMMSSLMSALLFGGMYWKLGRGQHTIQDRLGLLQVCSINSAMTSLVKTLNVFPREGALVNRERVRRTYNVFEYLTSKLFAELPVGALFPLVFSSVVYPMARLSGGVSRLTKFLGVITLESFTCASYGLVVGALFPSTDTALAVGPSTFVMQVVFGGLYITDKSVPKWAAWIPKISIIKHAFEALCINELRGLTFDDDDVDSDGNGAAQGGGAMTTGEQVLKRFSWTKSSVAKSCMSQARILAFNYLLTYTILELKKPRFEKLLPPIADQPQQDDGAAAAGDTAGKTAVATAAATAEQQGTGKAEQVEEPAKQTA